MARLFLKTEYRFLGEKGRTAPPLQVPHAAGMWRIHPALWEKKKNYSEVLFHSRLTHLRPLELTPVIAVSSCLLPAIASGGQIPDNGSDALGPTPRLLPNEEGEAESIG
jgi:hypothetical protein